MMMLIRNLDTPVTQENLKTTFAAFGRVNSVYIFTEESFLGQRRFGFVDMNEAEAQAAIKALHHIMLFNEKIRVTKANPKFGPDYYAKRKNPPVLKSKTVMPAYHPTGQTERPEFKPGAKRPPASDKRAYANSRFAQRNNGKPEYKPRSDRPYDRNTSAGTGGKPYGHFEKRDGERFEHKPHGARPYDRNSSTGSKRPFGHFQKQGYKPGFAPRGERGYDYQGSKDGTGFPKRGSAKPDYKTQSDRPYGRNSSGGKTKPSGHFQRSARKFVSPLFSGKHRPK